MHKTAEAVCKNLLYFGAQNEGGGNNLSLIMIPLERIALLGRLTVL